jgi:alginate O-acetyltransferase complex protein AlgI
MIFTQLVFFIFFAVTLVVHWLLPGQRARKLWLLIASYFFYGWWDHRFLGLIALCTVIDYAVGLALGRVERPRARRLLIVTSLCTNLGILGFFKYFNFFVGSASELLRALGVPAATPTLEILLPAGISFFTFQTMSYTIDVYRRELAPCKNFLDFATFVAFFPQLVAGPIVRASAFLPQLVKNHVLSNVNARRVLLLFVVGYFKKACIADNIAVAIDPVFSDPEAHAAADRLLGAVLYSIQIYCDFSGYTDMAVACALAFGYELAKNFDAPYFSRNLREFWQRWHISLSSWLRDYLYVPLGGNRGGTLLTTRNLMLTMLLGGLWHGANWTFIVWGFLHGAGLVFHRMLSRRLGERGLVRAYAPKTATALATFFTFAWVALCFTIFRCADIGSAFTFLTASTPEAQRSLALDWWLLVAVLGLVHWLLKYRRPVFKARAEAAPDFVFYGACGAASALLVYFTPSSVEPFIYFQF